MLCTTRRPTAAAAAAKVPKLAMIIFLLCTKTSPVIRIINRISVYRRLLQVPVQGAAHLRRYLPVSSFLPYLFPPFAEFASHFCSKLKSLYLDFYHTCILFFLLEKTMVILSPSVEEYHTNGVFCGKGNTKPREWRSIRRLHHGNKKTGSSCHQDKESDPHGFRKTAFRKGIE